MEPEQRFSGKEDYAKHLVKRSNGEVTVDGLYPEKAPGQFMVRVRIPGGRITLAQASALADFAEEFADGEWHVDTRENIELHGVSTENVVPLVEAIETVDVPLILGTVIVTSLIVVVSGLLVDIVQGIVDPRIRHNRQGAS